MAIKFTKVSTKAPRPVAIKGGEVAAPKVSQLRGKGQNAGGSPNDLKRLFPKSKVSATKYPKAPAFSKGGKVGKPKCGC